MTATVLHNLDVIMDTWTRLTTLKLVLRIIGIPVETARLPQIRQAWQALRQSGELDWLCGYDGFSSGWEQADPKLEDDLRLLERTPLPAPWLKLRLQDEVVQRIQSAWQKSQAACH